MPSDAHEQLQAIASNSQIVRMNLHLPLLAAAAELKRLDNELATAIYLERVGQAELERLAGENAQLREALRIVRQHIDVSVGRIYSDRIDALLASAGPPQEDNEKVTDHEAALYYAATGRLVPDEDIIAPPPERRCTCNEECHRIRCLRHGEIGPLPDGPCAACPVHGIGRCTCPKYITSDERRSTDPACPVHGR